MPHSCPKEGGKGGERQRVTLIEGSVFFEQTLLTCVLKRGRDRGLLSSQEGLGTHIGTHVGTHVGTHTC